MSIQWMKGGLYMQKNTKNLFLSLLALMLIVSGILMTNPRTSYAATSTYKTTAALNVRIGPNASTTKVTTLKKNTVVTKVKASGSWWQIRYNTSKVGWVNKKYLKAVKTVTATAPAKKTYFYVTETTGLTMRKTASPSGAKSGVTVPYGAKLTVKKIAANGWLYVTYNKKTGWISGDDAYGFKSTTSFNYTAKATSKIQYVTVNELMNVRRLPNTSSPKLGSISKKFTAVILRTSNNNWAEIQFSKTQKGWISLNTRSTVVTTKKTVQVSDPVDDVLAGYKIVLDAGHGGTDPGAVGKDLKGKKVTEAELTLASAKAIQEAIEKVGGSVSMTRSTTAALNSNKTKDLAARAAASAKVGANAFISIHYNSASSSAEGLEALYYQTSSKEFATIIQKNIMKSVNQKYKNVRDRGTKYQNVMVLRENTVFATLIELGFVSNAKELSRVNTDEYRQTIAEGVVNGLIEYYKK